MNYKQIAKIVGISMSAVSAFMVLPLVVAIIYKESSGIWFLPVMAFALAVGIPLSHIKINTKFNEMYARDAYASVALTWIVMSLIGCLPFWLSGEIKGFINCFFEIVSGFTTTGASIMSPMEIDAMSKCMLFWRSFSHWAGGMGVLVFVLAFMPSGSENAIHILRAESTGPSVNKIASKMKHTASILYLLYTVMTLICFVLLVCGGMPVFDSITTAFATAGTGGFAVTGAGMGGYNSFYLQGVVTVFMALFGVNFSLYYLMLLGDFKSVFKNEELRGYVITIFVAIALITVNIRGGFGSLYEAFHHAAFQVSSIITTTGFSTVDFNAWPLFSKTILVILMFFGACAGSTGGGIKISRLIILSKSLKKEIYTLIHPRGVKVMLVDGKKIEHETVRRTNVYMVCYLAIFIISILIVSLDNISAETAFTSVTATLNNIGPGLDQTGPSAHFGFLSPLTKVVLILDMLIGRLEIFPMLVLFYPGAWRKE